MKSPSIVSACLLLSLAALQQPQVKRPNVAIFLTDDQGYGDLSSFGHPTIRTPNIDRLAAEGIRLTSFYAAPSCTPSRAQLLTGRYAFRSEMFVPYGPGAPNGLGAGEVTLADALKRQGYRTGMFGKWHLGDFDTRPAFNPLRHGFDVFLGVPYSHDYRQPFVQDAVRGVPLYRGYDQVERPVVANTLTQRFTEEAIRFIRDSRGQPFFLYVAYNMPHLPAGASDRFSGRSTAGRYGDAVEEIDWSVGEVMAELKTLGLDGNTITMFFSDNGPWSNAQARSFQEGQTLWDTGSAGPLRGAKGTTWEGGMRVPAAIRWPGTIPSGRISSEMVSELDLFPTFVSLAGGAIARERASDGYDLMPFLMGVQPTPRHELYYINNRDLQAVRDGRWKLRIADGEPPALFDLDRDPGERLDVSPANPELVTRLRALLDRFRPQVPAARPPGQ
jgi:arylsulfatase A-like enzyme